MQPVVVQKYGGSSVASPERILQVARRIADTRESGRQVVAVVSAMGDTTDELYAQARKITDSPSRRELDMLLSCGERASMALLSMAVNHLGYDAISFTGSQCGILTNDRHSGARIIEVRPVRVQDELERGKVVIVAGFQGVSYKREITTLGRGGSDTTAVALAAALGAERCEICSDVDGVLSADPRLVGAAELIDAISHDEMLELSSHGAVVLHPESVEFARRAGIALYARRTSSSAPGTRVDVTERIDASLRSAARAVTGQKDLVRISAPAHKGGIAELMSAAEHYGFEPCHVHASGSGIHALVALDDTPDWRSIAARLSDDGFAVEDGWGAVTAVATGLGRDPVAIRTAVEIAGERVRELSVAPLRITLLCGSDEVDALVVDLHGALVAAREES